MAQTVLVLDAKQRSALAVTRSLGKLPDVIVVTADAAAKALAGCSRFSSSYLISPSAEQQPELYLDWLRRTLSERQIDLVIPVTEITSQLLLMNKNSLPKLELPFASYEIVKCLADKGALVRMAVELDVPVPKSRWFMSAQELNIDAEAFPLVVKPCFSKIFTGTEWITTRVAIVHSKEELLEELNHSEYLKKHPFLLQEFIPGHGAGVFCLYDHGQPQAFFAHRRIREKPPQGGVSVVSESVAVDPVLKAYACKLLDAVKWHGVAMVEFRIDPEGKPFLMEVNTRFWGSLQLAIDSGVDFPAMLLRGLQTPGEPPLLVNEEYRIGQQLRWWLGDLDSLYVYLKGKYSWDDKLKRIMQFMRLHSSNCRHEVDRWGDMGPARHEFALYLRHLLGR